MTEAQKGRLQYLWEKGYSPAVIANYLFGPIDEIHLHARALGLLFDDMEQHSKNKDAAPAIHKA